MGEFGPIHFLIVLAIIVLLFGGRRIPKFPHGSSGPGPKTPNHPVPVTGPVETRRPARSRENGQDCLRCSTHVRR
jgi:hypothetical protein